MAKSTTVLSIGSTSDKIDAPTTREAPGSVHRILGARLEEETVRRFERTLISIFGPSVPHAAKSEIMRLAVRYGLAEIEYRISRGLPADDSPGDVLDELPQRSSITMIRRALRHSQGYSADKRERQKLARQDQQKREIRHLRRQGSF